MRIKQINNVRVIIGISVLLIIITLGIIYQNYIIVVPVKNIDFKYGVIDGHISSEYQNVTYNTLNRFDDECITHGDLIVKFIRNLDNQSNIFYYDAENEEGKISSENIILGLNWMLNNGVDKVNISLSSSFYSKELEKWISTNADYIKIYASYNNKINSLDYPAMYQNVIGSGYNKKIKYKDIDKTYKTNKILVWTNILEKYEGTSYLSPWTMLSEK